jgi:hypothetical protein
LARTALSCKDRITNRDKELNIKPIMIIDHRIFKKNTQQKSYKRKVYPMINGRRIMIRARIRNLERKTMNDTTMELMSYADNSSHLIMKSENASTKPSKSFNHKHFLNAIDRFYGYFILFFVQRRFH